MYGTVFTSDAQELVYRGSDGTFVTWNVQKHSEQRTLSNREARGFSDMWFASDGSHQIEFLNEKLVLRRIVDQKDIGTSELPPEFHRTQLDYRRGSPTVSTGMYFAALSEPESVLGGLSTNKLLVGSFRDPSQLSILEIIHPVNAIRFSPNEKLLAVAGGSVYGNFLSVWETDKWNLIGTFKLGDLGGISGIQFSPDAPLSPFQTSVICCS